MTKIRLTSITDEQLIHPSELLMPVNGITNFVNLLDNFEQICDDYVSRQMSRNQEPDLVRYLNNNLLHRSHTIYRSQENNSILIESMSKKSPYWIDFVLNVSPFVLEIIHLVIESHENEIVEKLKSILSKFPWFKSKTSEDLLKLVRVIIRYFRLTLRFVQITFENN